MNQVPFETKNKDVQTYQKTILPEQNEKEDFSNQEEPFLDAKVRKVVFLELDFA